MKRNGISYTSTRRHGPSTSYSSQSYRPELDSTDFCNPQLSTIFQNFIGVLRWIVELGRIDIQLETSILSQYLAQPRIGHLEQACNIFRYLKKVNSAYVVMDPTPWEADWIGEQGEVHPRERARYMKELYPVSVYKRPHDMPDPLGEGSTLVALSMPTMLEIKSREGPILGSLFT